MKTCLSKSKKNFFLCLVAILLFPAFGYSQEEDIAKYPSRVIECIHPYPPGTPGDLAVRLISKQAEKFLGQPITVINKPGAAGALGTAALAKSKPDGYTIGNAQPSPTFMLPLLEKVPYHPLKDLAFIMQYAVFNMGVIVKGDSPFKSFKDLIDYARENPKKLSYGTAGTKSMPNIIMGQFAKKANIEFTHIPFKSTVETQPAILGGHVTFGAGDFNYSLVESGETKLLVLLREERAEEYPQVPILKELGYDIPMPMPQTLAGPRGIPEGILKKLEGAYTKAMKEPAFIKGMKDLRVPIRYRNSQELTEYVTYNFNFFEKLLKETGLKD